MILVEELIKSKADVELRKSILKVLAYFDCFAYPLSVEEITYFLDEKQPDCSIVLAALKKMCAEKIIFYYDCFYLLKDIPTLAEQRLKSNKLAQKLLPIGKRIARFLFCFPFVSGVGISGSLSKNVADEKSDIDYFIITKKNRLWIARSFLHAFKKLSYITGSQHKFCMNYFIDEEAFEIKEKNIFIAIELITLLPVSGNKPFPIFFNSNKWISNFCPNAKVREITAPINSPLIKRIIEFFLDNRLGNWLDNYLMKVTANRWKEKELKHKLSIKGTRMGLTINKHFSKPNPIFFQAKLLAKYQYKLSEVGIKY